jgi:hypothetical protein
MGWIGWTVPGSLQDAPDRPPIREECVNAMTTFDDLLRLDNAVPDIRHVSFPGGFA